ncbi:MAG: hypothetical protein PQJ44_05040 [Sphaerochaetaceae bacterium]|nr:hypothetical protein [Sphaerochaetaceae bacterium]
MITYFEYSYYKGLEVFDNNLEEFTKTEEERVNACRKVIKEVHEELTDANLRSAEIEYMREANLLTTYGEYGEVLKYKLNELNQIEILEEDLGEKTLLELVSEFEDLCGFHNNPLPSVTDISQLLDKLVNIYALGFYRLEDMNLLNTSVYNLEDCRY